MTPEQESVLRLAIEWKETWKETWKSLPNSDDVDAELYAAVTRMQSAPEPAELTAKPVAWTPPVYQTEAQIAATAPLVAERAMDYEAAERELEKYVPQFGTLVEGIQALAERDAARALLRNTPEAVCGDAAAHDTDDITERCPVRR